MASSITLLTARAEIARRSTEFVQSTATGGSTTTLIDVNNLQYVDSYWNEQTVLFTSGANSGLQRKINAYTSASSQATLYSSVTSAVVSGDSYELYRRFSPVDIKGALNAAINNAWPSFYERAIYYITPIQDQLQYAFPSGVDVGTQGLMKVEYQAHNLPTQTTWPYQELGTDMWDVIEDWNGTQSLKTVQLKFVPDPARQLRLTYGSPLRPVAADADVISIGDPEAEWLYAKTIEQLWRLEASRSESVARKDALEERSSWKTKSDELERKLGNPPDPTPLRRTRFYVVNT